MLINANFQKKEKDNVFIFQIKYLYIKYLHKRIVKKYING